MNFPTDDYLEKIRKHRKAFFLWIPICFLIASAIILFLQIVPEVTPKWFDLFLNIISNAIWFLLFIRISTVRCPVCGKSILRLGSLPLSLKNIKCRHCDYQIR
jgi:hypothetical protein